MDHKQLQSLFDLTDRVAIVTGGTRGIGYAIAEGLIAAGARVTIASRKAEACTAAEGRLTTAGGDVLAVRAHLGDPDAPAALVQATVERFGRLDIVINNAANALALPLGSLTPDAWDKAHAVNLRGPVFLVQEAMPHLAASPGAAVLNIVSAAAFVYAPGKGMYAGAKAALVAWTRTMAAELAPMGIRVNALSPGVVATDMVRNTSAEDQEVMAAANLLGRMADADEMVGPALFLVSDAASYVTGQTVLADAGMVAH